MKKIILLIALTLMMASTAQAATKVHGDFSTDSSGCAACHITHASNAAKLLLTGANQTEFCEDCHGLNKPKSPYDTKNGATLTGTGTTFDYAQAAWATWDATVNVLPSYSGGFSKTYNFEGAADAAMAGSAVAAGTNFLTSSSAHNVEGITLAGGGTPWNSSNKIPGGTAAVSGSVFTCSSCHDPHGYNSTQAGGGGSADNPRLLRKDLPARSNIDVAIDLDITTDGTNMTEGTLRTTGYPDASINKWCGGCHDMLDVGKNAGSNKGADTRYRHAMGIAVGTAPTSTSLAVGTPLATGTKLICLSCHRAHGTAVSMSSVANSWTGQDYDNTGNANSAKSGSALLRLKNRDVCYKCHLAAGQNINATAGAARAAATY